MSFIGKGPGSGPHARFPAERVLSDATGGRIPRDGDILVRRDGRWVFEPVGEGGTAAPVDLTNYYTRAEVDEIIADLPPDTDTGEVNTASNVGVGAEVFKEKVGVDLRFRSLVAGDTTIQIVEDDDEIAIYGAAVPPGSGEANTASNLGTAGEGVFFQKTGVDLEFKKLLEGSGIDITSDDEAITIARSSFRGARARATATKNTTNAAPVISWDVEDYDTDAIWSAGQPTRLIVPAGVTVVRLSFNVTTAGETHNWRAIVQKNAAGTSNIQNALFGSSDYTSIALAKILSAYSLQQVSAGDYFELFVYSSANSNLQPLTGAEGCWFAMEIVQ